MPPPDEQTRGGGGGRRVSASPHPTLRTEVSLYRPHLLFFSALGMCSWLTPGSSAPLLLMCSALLFDGSARSAGTPTCGCTGFLSPVTASPPRDAFSKGPSSNLGLQMRQGTRPARPWREPRRKASSRCQRSVASFNSFYFASFGPKPGPCRPLAPHEEVVEQ